MTRKLGSRDLRQRKTRCDKGLKRKIYSGKPVKGKHKRYFERRIGNSEYIKIWIWERVPMSEDGYRRFNRHIRAKMHKQVTRMLNVHQVHVSDIDTKEKIEDFVAENYWAGTFLVMGFSNAKNRYHCKPVKICRIVVKEIESGNIGRMVNNYRLSKYKWFYKG